MSKKVIVLSALVLVAAAGAGGYYWIKSEAITEAQVRQFYDGKLAAMGNGEQSVVCASVTADYSAKASLQSASGITSELLNKQSYCEKMSRIFALAKTVSPTGMKGIKYSLKVGKIDIARDKKTASAEVSSIIDMGAAMYGSDHGVDTLTISLGKVLLRESVTDGIIKTAAPQ